MNDTLRETGSVEIESVVLPAVPELSQLMVHLLKGVLYREDDERLWESLLRLQARVREQAAVLLLDLVLDEAEGHAFLKSRPDPDESEGASRLPRLVARRPLSYPVSLMLACCASAWRSSTPAAATPGWCSRATRSPSSCGCSCPMGRTRPG